MAAPRSSSLRALRILSQQSNPIPIRRSLHITGSHSAPPTKPSDKSSLYASYTLTNLQTECQKRSLRSVGSKPELIERLTNNDILQTRAFSIALRRINSNGFTDPSTTRQFNTSRSEKSVNDTSPVDFVYMPSMQEVEAPARPSHPRVPVLPEIPSIAAVHYTSKPGAGAGAGTEVEADAEAEPMKPQVYTVSGAGSEVAASPMSEVVDNHAVEIDPFSLTETVGKARFEEESKRGVGLSSGAASTAAGAGEEKKGIVREVWSGILDDLLGPKNQGQSSNRSAN